MIGLVCQSPDTMLTVIQELNAIFVEYRVLSSKILRDSMGNSRGVGFARYVLLVDHAILSAHPWLTFPQLRVS
jgi:hypothetical protein